MHSSWYVVVFILLLSGKGSAQTYVADHVDVNLPSGKIDHLAKDCWNRLIIGQGSNISAYDGRVAIPALNLPKGRMLLDVFGDREKSINYYLTNQTLYEMVPRWQKLDSLISMTKLKGPVIFHFFDGEHLIYQSAAFIVYHFHLPTRTEVALPYTGEKLTGIDFIDGVIYLFDDIIYTYDIDKKSFNQTNLKLPSKDIYVIPHNHTPYVLSARGQLWQLNLKSQSSEYIDRIPISSKVVDAKITGEKIFIFTQSQGIIRFNVSTKKISYVHGGNGLCSNRIGSFFIGQTDYFWTADQDQICLTTDKGPIIADRDMGLVNERIKSITEFNKRLYFSTGNNGFYQLFNDKILPLNSTNGFVDTRVTNLQPISSDRLLIATTGSGLIEMTNRNEFIYLDSALLSGSHVQGITKLSPDSLIISTKNSGLWRLTKSMNSAWTSRRIFPSQIKNINDVAEIYNGDLIIATDSELIYYNHKHENIYPIYQNYDGLILNDLTLWDGWIYAIMPDEFIRIPMTGKDAVPEYLNNTNGIRSVDIQSIHAHDGLIYITDQIGTYTIPISHFDRPNEAIAPNSYDYKISKNGLLATNKSLIAATDKGLVDVNHDIVQPSQATLVWESFTINNETYKSLPTYTFDGKQNRWLFTFASISPESKAELSYQWKLVGKNHSFSGNTDQRSIYFPYLPTDEYTMSVDLNTPQINTKPLLARFCIAPRFYNTTTFRWLVLIAGLFGLALLAFLIKKFTSSRLKRKNAELRWQNEKLEWQQKALQLQMNPHFIFNVLNSIQSLIGKDDKQARYYIAKLGKLMRLTLHHAREKWITLADEIGLLEAYLDLEKLNHSFSYQVINKIDNHVIEIPPMMIQPLVENAVKHGVHRRSKDGHIDVEFKYLGRKVVCIVRDNGPGLTDKSENDKHMSVSTKIINERMAVYEKEGIKVDPVQIRELNGADQSGTEVQIGLPYKHIDQT